MLRYFLLSSGNTVVTTASWPMSFWVINAPRKLAPDEIPTAETEAGRQFLGHQDGVAIVNAHYRVKFFQFQNRGDELVRDALDAMLADLVPN